MASTLPYLLLISLLTLLYSPSLSAAPLQSTTALFRSQSISDSSSTDIPPTRYFQVTHPIQTPNSKPCSYLDLQHQFAFTYGKPPVLAHYSPPSRCTSPTPSKIVLEWSASCIGRQFDRIFGVWLGGVEILRSCTAEPRSTGTVWTVRKDITRYSSLLLTNQTLAVYLGNIVDGTYTGIYHVNLTFHYYIPEDHHILNTDINDVHQNGELGDELGIRAADLIIPISRDLPLNDGLWFEVSNSTDLASKEFKVPQNVYRAVLEVYISFHENDEFWFGNFPNEYIEMNNVTSSSSNGPFREVVISLDGSVIGAICPFTVIYTGGVNPLLWRPITGIGSFDLPSYDVEITPLLGMLLDGNVHDLKFGVTNALNVWYIDANLHLWLDKKSQRTQGKVLELTASPLSLSLVSNFTGFDGQFITNADRLIVSTGWVNSSSGSLLTKSIQRFEYTNYMTLGNKGSLQILDQVINLSMRVENKKSPSTAPILSTKAIKKFTLKLYSNNVDTGRGSYDSLANVTLGIDEKRRAQLKGQRAVASREKNVQNGEGSMSVKGNLVVSGWGRTQEEYEYVNNEICYSRKVGSSNYTVLYDEESGVCKSVEGYGRGHFLHRVLHGGKTGLA